MSDTSHVDLRGLQRAARYVYSLPEGPSRIYARALLDHHQIEGSPRPSAPDDLLPERAREIEDRLRSALWPEGDEGHSIRPFLLWALVGGLIWAAVLLRCV